jgi:hypothetical protein
VAETVAAGEVTSVARRHSSTTAFAGTNSRTSCRCCGVAPAIGSPERDQSFAQTSSGWFQSSLRYDARVDVRAGFRESGLSPAPRVRDFGWPLIAHIERGRIL